MRIMLSEIEIREILAYAFGVDTKDVCVEHIPSTTKITASIDRELDKIWIDTSSPQEGAVNPFSPTCAESRQRT